jgi:Kef-type K+ transport system membrane component KefB/Trk K+ transport system NAD-binding subunit
MQNAFFEIAAILSLAALLGFVGQKLRQPLLIMFLATGILVGPAGLGIIASYHQIELLAHIGVALLLFIVGLKLDLHLIRTIGPVALATGLGQIGFTSVIGLLIALALGMSFISAAYVAVALTFSSTIIIVKLLSDKKEIDSLHGQIALGFLIVQDIAAILALVGLTTLGSAVSGGGGLSGQSLAILVKGVLFLGCIGLLTRYLLPGLTRRLAQSQEMLILFAIAWAVFLGAASEWLGFSKEVGAFLGGVSLASTPFRDAIGTRLTSLRDFLLLFFFIDLGARLDWSTVGAQLGDSFIFSIFVLIGNPLIVLIIMGVMGYRSRTSFLAGLTVAQISEFSLIVAALGLSLGHISPETMGLVTLVGVVTIFLSSYMIIYSGGLYTLLARPLKLFERRNPYREASMETVTGTGSVDVVLFGLGNYGSAVAEQLLRRRKTIAGVDFDPAALSRWHSRGINALYGDLTDPELHDLLPIHKAKWVVCTVRSQEINLALLSHLRIAGFKGGVALTATDQVESDLYKKLGATVVFRPFIDAAEQAADLLTHNHQLLPDTLDWPISFLEIRIRPDAAIAGQTISTIPMCSLAGVTILAVNRAGTLQYDPNPDFQIFPGDRLIVIGPQERLHEAEMLLNSFSPPVDALPEEAFELTELPVDEAASVVGLTLAESQIRRKFGVTVVGIGRGEQQLTDLDPKEKILACDRLIILGQSSQVRHLQRVIHDVS